jgi:aminoglycoside phosphotransferase family enzyme
MNDLQRGPDLRAKVAFLRQAVAYPDRPRQVEAIETHMSWVFLTERYVYKMKKPVRTPFLDFSTLQLRRRDCEEEVRLNRRLAADVYLGVVPLTLGADGELALEGEGEAVEWLVKMVRLPHEHMLDYRIATGSVEPAEVETFTKVLVAFYQQAEPVAMTPAAYRQRYLRDIEANHRALLAVDALPAAQLTSIRTTLLQWLEQSAATLEARAAQDRVIEAHGDLRPEHICLIDPPVFIDCLEFKREFRLLDPVEELAFLALECESAGAAFIGDIVFQTWRDLTGEQPAAGLVAFYKAWRAQLRAKLSASHLEDHLPRGTARKWIDKTRAYLDLASAYAARLSQGTRN